jgi:hypothetical protein
VHGRWVLLYVLIELILCEWSSIPVIKVKQKRCRQMDWSISLHYTFQVDFLKKVISNVKLLTQAWGETNLWCNWYVSNVSTIFDAPCLFLHHLPNVLLHFVALLCIFRN